MAAPFGNHPTLLDYIAWCNSQGCTTKSCLQIEGGTSVTVQLLETRDGSRHVVVSGISNNERLVPTMVAYFDRRLELNSPFSKTGDGTVNPLN